MQSHFFKSAKSVELQAAVSMLNILDKCLAYTEELNESISIERLHEIQNELEQLGTGVQQQSIIECINQTKVYASHIEASITNTAINIVQTTCENTP